MFIKNYKGTPKGVFATRESLKRHLLRKKLNIFEQIPCDTSLQIMRKMKDKRGIGDTFNLLILLSYLILRYRGLSGPKDC